MKRAKKAAARDNSGLICMRLSNAPKSPVCGGFYHRMGDSGCDIEGFQTEDPLNLIQTVNGPYRDRAVYFPEDGGSPLCQVRTGQV